MYQRILVPLDGSHLAEQALPHAKAQAQALNLRLLLVTATSGAERVGKLSQAPVQTETRPRQQS